MSIETKRKTEIPKRRIDNPSDVTTPVAEDTKSSSVWWIRGIAAVIAVGGIALGANYLIGKVSTPDTGPKLTHEIKRGNLIVSVTEEGRLESSSNKEIKCQVEGGSTILWIIEDGTLVKPGDELVRLDTSGIEESISQQKITYQNALATHVQSQSDVAVAKINVTEYLDGTFPKEMKTAQSNVAVGEGDVLIAQNILNHAKKMFRKGYVSKLQLQGNESSLLHAQLQLELYKTEVEVLEQFTKQKTLQELKSALQAAEAKLASDAAALKLEEDRLARAEKQLENSVIVAESNGMVIYPETEEWKNEPAIEEGSTVRERQTLLQIPDLSQMQVVVGIHEAKVHQLKIGMPARVEIQGVDYDGKIDSIASTTGRVGWWNGNVVKYDTNIKLDSPQDLKPGMTAEVEVFLGRHEGVLTIPVAAVVQNEQGYQCWVKTASEPKRRVIELGDSNDEFIVIKAGLKEGDHVVLNPLAFIEEAQLEAQKPAGESGEEPAEDNPEEARTKKPQANKLPAGGAKKTKPSAGKQQSKKPQSKKPAA